MVEEILDVVDDTDTVISSVPKSKVYEDKLLHRIVHILVFNSHGEMGLQLRSKNASFCPLHWSTAVGGHVQSGEDPKDAALREYEEELGTQSEIEFFAKDMYEANGLRKFLITFKTIHNGPFAFDDPAVEKMEFFSLDTIKSMIDSDEKIHPELLFILQKHFF